MNKKKTPLISVVIATRDRPEKIINCLHSLFGNTFDNFQIYLVDQSSNDLTGEKVKELFPRKIKYFRLSTKGKSRALNHVLPRIKSEIIAFTDDDCIAQKNWLERIKKLFDQYPEVDSLFGQVIPYQPSANTGRFCACYFLKEKKELIKEPCVYWEEIGFGCNMAHRKKVFEKVEKFPTWLGPGSVGRSGDDGYLILKLLANNFKVLYEPVLKVFHDRWLSTAEFEKQQLDYFYSEMVCCAYFALKGLPVGKRVVKYAIIDLIKDGRNIRFRKLLTKSGLLMKAILVAGWGLISEFLSTAFGSIW